MWWVYQDLQACYELAEILVPNQIHWAIVGSPLYESIMDRRLVWRAEASQQGRLLLKSHNTETPIDAIEYLIAAALDPDGWRWMTPPQGPLRYPFRTDDEQAQANVRELLGRILKNETARHLVPTDLRNNLMIRGMWIDGLDLGTLWPIPRSDQD